jgi:hypothetical protein
MTFSRTPPVWTEIRTAEELSGKALGYFRARLKNRLHQLVLAEFERAGCSKASIAKRIDKRPEQITRLLGAPGNWTLDTVSDLLLAMQCELDVTLARFNERGSQTITLDWNTDGGKISDLSITKGTSSIKSVANSIKNVAA